MTHDPMKSAAADAAATAAAYSARNTYALGWEAGARASRLEEGTEYQHLQETLDAAESRIAVEASRADVAEQRVCELRDAADGLLIVARDCQQRWSRGHPAIVERGQAALSSTADIAGRWVSRAEHERVWDIGAQAERARDDAVDRHREIRAERDAAIARAETSDAVARALGADFTRVLRECGEAERARDEVGIQLVAAQERLRLAMVCVEHLRDAIEDGDIIFQAPIDALATLDTVPGDALARPIDTENPVSHLEALGIDINNVKGGE